MGCPYGCIATVSTVIVAIQFIAKFLPWLYQNIIGPMVLAPKVSFRDYGKWALVTGATDGIGKAYARQLAKQGCSILLVSRSQAKLETVAAEIAKDFKVPTKVIAVDFSEDAHIYTKIAKEIEGLDIGVLVNNVGVSYAYPEFFLDVPNSESVFEQIFRCNMTSVINMCKIVLPQMVNKKKGLIINISSMSGTIPGALIAVYSASKAFVDKFSNDLNTEYSPRGVTVQSVLPGFVVSNMSKVKRASFMCPSADDYAASALRTVGYANYTTGYWPHALMQGALTTLSTYLPDFANTSTLSWMYKIRNKALKQAQKAQTKTD